MTTIKTIKKLIDIFSKGEINSIKFRILRKAFHIYERLSFRPYIIRKTISGETINLFINDLFAKHWYDRSECLDTWPELDWIKNNLIAQGDVVADCGANIGFTGIFFAKCVGSSGKVVGFEALPANVETARQNIHLNEIANFDIQHKALGSCTGEIKFVDYPNGSVGEIDGLRSIVVPMIKLDDFFKLDKPNLLKIDVEGYEIEVLKGAQEILKERPKLSIEIHCTHFQDRIKSIHEIFELLSLLDYQFHLQLKVGDPIISYDPNKHTPEFISQHENIQLFGIAR